MFSKKERPKDTVRDIQIKALRHNLFRTKFLLEQAVEDCITADKIVSIYPKKIAIEKAETEKAGLIAITKDYDNLVKQYNEMLFDKKNRVTTLDWENSAYKDSYNMIKNIIKNFYKNS